MIKDRSFCCNGCLAVFSLLDSQKLTHYYDLLDSCSLPKPRVNSDFAYTDLPEFEARYSVGTKKDNLEIYVGGVHCSACLWLLEKIGQYVPGIEKANLNLGSQVLRVQRNPQNKISDIFKQIEAWGYQPIAVQTSNDLSELKKAEYKKDLYRLGVAAAGAGNIMLMSVCLYAGAEGTTKIFLEWSSFLVSLPVLFFSAVPLFLSSWAQLKTRRVSVDLPMTIALITAFLVSIYGLFYGTEIYFDSVTALVFMILANRFWFKRVQEKNLNLSTNAIGEVTFARKVDGTEVTQIIPDQIKKGDRIRVLANEIIPVDGKIELGHGYINQSLMTGESIPCEVSYNGFVFMGSKLLTGELDLIATQNYSNSRIPKLLREVENLSPRPDTLRVIDLAGQYFLYVVLALVICTFVFFFPTDPHQGLYRALSLIIVACPCTFASVVPLILTLSMRKLRQNGIFVRNAAVFEKIEGIRNIYFDKTGTLTEGNFEVLTWEWLANEDFVITGKIFAATVNDEHPVSKSVAAYIAQNFGAAIVNETFKTHLIPAKGVEVRFESGDVVRVCKTEVRKVKKLAVPNAVKIYFNDREVALVTLGDQLRPESKEVISKINSLQYRSIILSGDQKLAVDWVGENLGIPNSNRYANLTLDQKAEILHNSKKSIMVGDGNNDALAIGAATIGIAVTGGVETALKSSDVYLANQNLNSLVNFLNFANRTNYLIKQALVISIFYNVVAGALALSGIIHPILAAFIMPLNALTSFSLSFWQLRRQSWT
jgi:heavy metal translocating P-type ATPase